MGRSVRVFPLRLLLFVRAMPALLMLLFLSTSISGTAVFGTNEFYPFKTALYTTIVDYCLPRHLSARHCLHVLLVVEMVRLLLLCVLLLFIYLFS